MGIKIESYKLVGGGKLLFVKKGFAHGKKAFLKEGWIQAKNPKYVQKGRKTAHYNNVMKVWIVE